MVSDDFDFVLRNYTDGDTRTMSSIEEVVAYGKELGFNTPTANDFASKVYNYAVGEYFDFKGKTFAVYTSGVDYVFFHDPNYRKSVGKSFNDMVKKQRAKGIEKGFDSYTTEGMNPIFSDDAGAIKNIENKAGNIIRGVDFIYTFEKDYENGKIKNWDDFYMVRDSMKAEVEKWKGWAQFIIEECDRILR